MGHCSPHLLHYSLPCAPPRRSIPSSLILFEWTLWGKFHQSPGTLVSRNNTRGALLRADSTGDIHAREQDGRGASSHGQHLRIFQGPACPDSDRENLHKCLLLLHIHTFILMSGSRFDILVCLSSWWLFSKALNRIFFYHSIISIKKEKNLVKIDLSDKIR